MRPYVPLQGRWGGLLMCSVSPSRSSDLRRGSFVPARLSRRAGPISRPNDSPYYIGLDRVREDPYDRVINPHGIVQLGLSENKVVPSLSIVSYFDLSFHSSSAGVCLLPVPCFFFFCSYVWT